MKEPQHEKKDRSVGTTLTYVMTVVLLVIVVVAFVGTPAVSSIAGGSRISFGSYAGRDIALEPGNYLDRTRIAIARRVQQQDQQVTETLFRQIWRSAFQQTVFHEAMMVLADEAGVDVASTEVDRAIARWPEFQVDGEFSSAEYNAMSSQARFALRQYLEEVLIDERVRADLFGDTRSSDAEKAFLTSMAGPERQFRFVQFGFSEFPRSEVIEYGEANAGRFRRINLSVITIGSSESDARSIREQAVSRQASFEDLARNQSTDSYSDEGGEMGWIYFHELEPDFEDPAVIEEIFELEEGEISRVFETTFGWTIYRVNEAPIEPDFTDADVVAAVRDYMTVFERGLIEDSLNARAEEFVATARSQGYEAAAAAVDQSPQTTEYFPINYGNTPYFGRVNAVSNQQLSAAAFREEFFTELFELEAGDVSDPIVVRDYVFVFELADERDATEETVEFVEQNVDLIIGEFTQQQVQATYVNDELLVDNFNQTYNRAILGN